MSTLKVTAKSQPWVAALESVANKKRRAPRKKATHKRNSNS